MFLLQQVECACAQSTHSPLLVLRTEKEAILGDKNSIMI